MAAETQQQFEYDVFLSHSSKDKAVVRELAERLRSDGVRVWLDDWMIRPGDSIPLAIEQGLEKSRVLVLCMSKNASASEWVTLERHTAMFRDPTNQERRFIPLRLDDAPVKDTLNQVASVDWTSRSGKQYARLLQELKTRMDEEPPSVDVSSAHWRGANPETFPVQPVGKSVSVVRRSHSGKRRRTRGAELPSRREREILDKELKRRRSIVPYAVAALACFLCANALLYFILQEGVRSTWLKRLGGLYFVMVLPLGVAAAGCVFGLLRSYECYTGKRHARSFRLGGPIAVLAFIVLCGYAWLSPVPDTLTGRVVDAEGNPISDAIVQAEGVQTRVDSTGHFALDLSSYPARTRVTLSASAPGFEPFSLSFSRRDPEPVIELQPAGSVHE